MRQHRQVIVLAAVGIERRQFGQLVVLYVEHEGDVAREHVLCVKVRDADRAHPAERAIGAAQPDFGLGQRLLGHGCGIFGQIPLAILGVDEPQPAFAQECFARPACEDAAAA